MQVGTLWLGQNRDAGIPSPVVDKVKSLVGGTCTIFQRMNEAGDMLRVCTNVQRRTAAAPSAPTFPPSTPTASPTRSWPPS